MKRHVCSLTFNGFSCFSFLSAWACFTIPNNTSVCTVLSWASSNTIILYDINNVSGKRYKNPLNKTHSVFPILCNKLNSVYIHIIIIVLHVQGKTLITQNSPNIPHASAGRACEFKILHTKNQYTKKIVPQIHTIVFYRSNVQNTVYFFSRWGNKPQTMLLQ